MSDLAKHSLQRGAQYPFDATDEWWDGDGTNPPPAVDWAHAAARGILHDLTDRRGIKQGFAGIDHEVRVEIVESIANIVRAAAALADAGWRDE